MFCKLTRSGTTSRRTVFETSIILLGLIKGWVGSNALTWIHRQVTRHDIRASSIIQFIYGTPVITLVYFAVLRPWFKSIFWFIEKTKLSTFWEPYAISVVIIELIICIWVPRKANVRYGWLDCNAICIRRISKIIPIVCIIWIICILRAINS